MEADIGCKGALRWNMSFELRKKICWNSMRTMRIVAKFNGSLPCGASCAILSCVACAMVSSVFHAISGVYMIANECGKSFQLNCYSSNDT